ncbi:hypothetical protein KI387_002049, partial [Taxus chinensis]
EVGTLHTFASSIQTMGVHQHGFHEASYIIANVNEASGDGLFNFNCVEVEKVAHEILEDNVDLDAAKYSHALESKQGPDSKN